MAKSRVCYHTYSDPLIVNTNTLHQFFKDILIFLDNHVQPICCDEYWPTLLVQPPAFHHRSPRRMCRTMRPPTSSRPSLTAIPWKRRPCVPSWRRTR